MIQRCLAIFTNSLSVVADGKVESQYLVGSLSPAGHSINSHSFACGSFLRSSRCAGRTRNARNLERSFFLVPSRHDTVFQSLGANDSAKCFTETGCCCLPRRSRVPGRHLPFCCFAGRGDSPGFQTVVCSRTPTTYRKLRSVMPSRKS